jgi:hypothetical protein
MDSGCYNQRVGELWWPWKPGMMEYWNIGFFEKESLFHSSNIPLFRHISGKMIMAGLF